MSDNDNKYLVAGKKDGAQEKVVEGPKGGVITPDDVINEVTGDSRTLTSVIILCEWDDETSSMAYSSQSPRDLWWQITNACMRAWHMIGGV